MVSHFPQPAFQVLDMRLMHCVQTVSLNQLYDSQKSLANIGRQLIKLALNSSVQDFNLPSHARSIYQKRDYVQASLRTHPTLVQQQARAASGYLPTNRTAPNWTQLVHYCPRLSTPVLSPPEPGC
jgi:hypothetical protein